MQNFNNDDVNSMLEKLKKQAEAGFSAPDNVRSETSSAGHTNDEIVEMLKKHLSVEEKIPTPVSEDELEGEAPAEEAEPEDEYENEDELAEELAENEISEEISDTETESYDIVEKIAEPEAESENVTEPEPEGEYTVDEDIIKSVVDEALGASERELDEIVDEICEQVYSDEPVEEEIIVDEPADEPVEEEIIVDEPADDPSEEKIIAEEPADEPAEEEIIAEDQADEPVEEEIIAEESTDEPAEEEIIVEESAEESEPEVKEPEEEPISEESINYDEVLEGQQGTVFNKFVEDFTGDLDDVVFEAEITDSHAPNKQYTIFEDWEKLMEKKDYATAEDGIIPPTPDELAYSAEISRRASGGTDYFNPVNTENLDAVDIALMVALGGEGELNKTVGFEKIRQAVHDAEEQKSEDTLDGGIYGCLGKEYSSSAQNGEIKKKYRSDRLKVIARLALTLILSLVLLAHEISGWTGNAGFVAFSDNPYLFAFGGLQLLVICLAISFNKIPEMIKRPLSSSSIAYISSLIVFAVSIPHDILLVSADYADAGITFHSLSALLLIISLVYDLLEVSAQSALFDIVSGNEKKLVLEPYGRLRTDREENKGEIIDKDSYCISRVGAVDKYFEKTSAQPGDGLSRVITLVLCVSVALCVMLLLLLMGEELLNIVLGFATTLAFTLICAALCDDEGAFYTVHKYLKRYRTGIIGKSGAHEYGKCNILYFDDYNVFNKRSVRTKGLKLYDNNEIYRVLYHTQAVFSKVGGPLKGVFEFATTEMIHSKNVEIKEISKEGICALVDGKTSVVIGTGAFMKSRGIHPSYTAADVKAEETGEESIMFIAIGGKLGAKLYVTYHFSSEFEKLARKLASCGVGIGIRSCDPNVNDKWAASYGALKGFNISIVRPALKEIKPQERTIESGIVSAKNVRALAEALMMCIKLTSLSSAMTRLRNASVVIVGILSFALVLFSGINTVSILLLSLACLLFSAVTALLSHYYIKR